MAIKSNNPEAMRESTIDVEDNDGYERTSPPASTQPQDGAESYDNTKEPGMNTSGSPRLGPAAGLLVTAVT